MAKDSSGAGSLANEYTKKALESGLPPKQAAQITTDSQLSALDIYKLPFEQAVRLTTCFQMIAMISLNAPFAQAVKITSFSQLQNYRMSLDSSSSANATIAQEATEQPDDPSIKITGLSAIDSSHND